VFSGVLRHAILQKFTGVSELLTASVIGAIVLSQEVTSEAGQIKVPNLFMLKQSINCEVFNI
jgi:hypothetical protein